MSNNGDKKDKDSPEKKFFNELFELKEKEQNEQLYKNEFYVLEEEMKANKDQNSLQFMHNALLNKLMLEDYSPFPPKSEESPSANPHKDEKKKEEKDEKLIEEENEFLRGLHRINYLTFSPFGLSFFDENNKDQNLSDECLKEKEEKILNMIGFNYNEFEVNNDLLLNICQGFIDINKLKEENLIKSPDNNTTTTTSTNPTTTNTMTPSNNITTNPINSTNNSGSNSNAHPTHSFIMNNVPRNEIKESKKEDDEFSEEELVEEINQKRKNDFYKDIIAQYDNEIKKVEKNEKKKYVEKWKSLIKNKDNEYKEHLKKIKQEEEKKKQEEKKLRDLEKKKEKEKQEQIKSQIELKKGLEELLKKAKKRGLISNSTDVKNKQKPKNRRELSTKKNSSQSLINNKNTGNMFVLSRGLNRSLFGSMKNLKKDKVYRKKSE